MKFIDQTEIWITSGSGGDGIVSFRRARNMPKLGPDGGNGGNGGNVFLIADKGLNTLAPLRYRKEFRAEDGIRGGSSNCAGACAEDLFISVPLGTIASDASSGEKLGEVTLETSRVLVGKGGTRGMGNNEFVSSTNRAPRTATMGEKGIRRRLLLELKVLADIGLAGMPNAGKSTLLSRLSHARPKIADYPFTTLHPMLGVVESKTRERSFVVADIPGLIEGASQGKGLGFEFLRHLERTKVIAYVVDSFLPVDEVVQKFLDLQKELFTYNEAFREKQGIIVLNKIDLLDKSVILELCEAFAQYQLPVVAISAVTGDGLEGLIHSLGDILDRSNSKDRQLTVEC